MTDETSGLAGPVRFGIAAALVTVGVLVGGAVAVALDDSGDGDAGAETAAPAGQDSTGPTEHEQAHADNPAALSADHAMGGGHRHPRLSPYEQRYADASAEEQAVADVLLADVRTTLVAYQDVDAAVAAGYQAPRHPRSPRAHYLDPVVASEGHLLDPSRPNGLVYYTGGDGDPVLLGAFFIAPPGADAPTPAGDLVVWHSHDPACPDFFATEEAPCTDVRRMLHVWTVDQFEIVARRTGEPSAVRVTDPFGAPFGASITAVG